MKTNTRSIEESKKGGRTTKKNRFSKLPPLVSSAAIGALLSLSPQANAEDCSSEVRSGYPENSFSVNQREEGTSASIYFPILSEANNPQYLAIDIPQSYYEDLCEIASRSRESFAESLMVLVSIAQREGSSFNCPNINTPLVFSEYVVPASPEPREEGSQGQHIEVDINRNTDLDSNSHEQRESDRDREAFVESIEDIGTSESDRERGSAGTTGSCDNLSNQITGGSGTREDPFTVVLETEFEGQGGPEHISNAVTEPATFTIPVEGIGNLYFDFSFSINQLHGNNSSQVTRAAAEIIRSSVGIIACENSIEVTRREISSSLRDLPSFINSIRTRINDPEVTGFLRE